MHNRISPALDSMTVATAANVLQSECHNAALLAGWWVDKTGEPVQENPLAFSNKLCLIHSEISEAMEGDRKNLIAEIAGQYLRKGSQCYVEGSLKTRKYTDKDGVEKYTTEIRADRLQLLGEPRGGGENQRQSSDRQSNDRGGRDNQTQPAPQQSNQRQPERSPGQRSNPGNSQQPQRQQPAQNNGGGARPSSGFDDFDEEIPFASQAFMHDEPGFGKAKRMSRCEF